MPNGAMTENEHQELVRFFAPIAATLEDFGKQHNLRLGKYYHDGHAWDFTFPHPKKGTGKLSVRQHHDMVQVHGFRWWDAYEARSRHLRTDDEPPCPVSPGEVRRALEHMLAQILSWAELTKVVTGYSSWGRVSVGRSGSAREAGA
jgi:hypothetical protein